jgi:hypothetical protein
MTISFSSITFPGSAHTSVIAIDAAGDVFGNYQASNGLLSYDSSYEYSGGKFTAINIPGASFVALVGADASGDGFGNYSDANGSPHAFEYSGGVVTTINIPGASGFDAAGNAFGNYHSAGAWHTFEYSGGTLSAINVPPGVSTFVDGVNSVGDAFGNSYDANGTHGFIYSGGAFTTIPISGDSNIWIDGVNSAGAAFGFYTGFYPGDNEFTHGFVYKNGTLSTFDIPGANDISVSGVDSSGDAFGYYTDQAGVWHAFEYKGGTVSPLNLPGASSSTVIGVDDAGDVFGNYYDSMSEHAFELRGGTVTTINVPGASNTWIDNITAAGEILGEYTDSIGAHHAFIASVNSDPSVVTVAQFQADTSALDQDPAGFIVADTAANVAGQFDALNGDSHLDSIKLTDSGAPVLALSVVQALDDGAALGKIATPYSLEVADKGAKLKKLTVSQINALAADGVKTLLATTDINLTFTAAQSAALIADKIDVLAQPGHTLTETLSGGGYAEYSDAGLVLQKTVNTDGSYDIHHFQNPGSFYGVAYAADDFTYSKWGFNTGQYFYDALGKLVASETFKRNGSFALTLEGEVVQQKTVNPDSSYDFVTNAITGQSFSSDEIVVNSNHVQVAVSYDNLDGTGSLRLDANGLVVGLGRGQLNVTALGDVFDLNAHASESIFANNQTNEYLEFAPHFGSDTITGFLATGANHDQLQFDASAFGAGLTPADWNADWRALLAHTTNNAAGSAVIADIYGDSLTLNGVSKATLSAHAAVFNFV